MTLVNMCNNCPHNPQPKQENIYGAEVRPSWVDLCDQYKYKLPDDFNVTKAMDEVLRREMANKVSYQNRDMLYLIGEVPQEHREAFKKMYETMLERMVDIKLSTLNLS